jgi:hypothetical protein
VRSHLIQQIVRTEEAIEPLVERTIERDPGAWQALWRALDPRIEAIAGRWRVTGRLSSSWDERRDIVVRVMGRLRAHDFERLKMLHETLLPGEEAGWSWISRVTRRVALNHVRGHAEYLGVGVGDGGGRWASLVPLPEGEEDRLPESVRVVPSILAHEIHVYAEQKLRPEQLSALRLWLLGHEPEEMAGKLAVMDEKAAEDLVRSAVAQLRYRFAVEAPRRKPKNSF